MKEKDTITQSAREVRAFARLAADDNEVAIRWCAVRTGVTVRLMDRTLSIARTIGLAALVATGVCHVAACGADSDDHPTVTEAAGAFGQAYCGALKTCVGATEFDNAYPGGVAACGKQIYRIEESDDKSVCSEKEWDACVKDFQTTTCVPFDGGVAPLIPDSCRGC